MPAESMVNLPAGCASVSLSSRAGQAQVRVGFGGVELSQALLSQAALHLPQAFTRGWGPLRGILCLEPVSDKRGRRSLPRALLSSAIPASRCFLLLDTSTCLGHPVSTDGGSSWASLGTHHLPLYGACIRLLPGTACPLGAVWQWHWVRTAGSSRPIAELGAVLGWECCSQNTLRDTAPSTALARLLPGTQSSLWLSAGLAVQVWGF